MVNSSPRTTKSEGLREHVNKKQMQTATARKAICEATLSCLDEFGYAETTIDRITRRADISRGALTHHFPSKEDLMVATADSLLERGISAVPVRRSAKGSARATQTGVETDLLWLWNAMLNTTEGRGFVEILTAARTDKALKARIQHRLWRWNDRIDQRFLDLYKSASGNDEDVRLLLTICRVFFRGLLIHQRFVREEEHHAAMVARFIELVAPHLRLR